MAPPMPRLNGRRTTYAPRSAATPAVRSVEPSSTTTISKPGSKARISSITRPTVSSSFRAGTIARRLSSASRARTASRGGAGTSASSATRRHRRRDAGALEDLQRPVRIGVLVQDALPRAPAHRLCPAGIVEQLPVRRERLVGGRGDAELGSGLEPPLDALLRIGDDRGAGGGELEWAARRRGIHRRVRAARDVEVDARARDRLREHVEGHVADEARVADVAAEVAPAEREVDLPILPARLPDEGLHPFAAELVAVAVEEHVVLLLDRRGLEHLGVGGPEDGLCAARAELTEPLEPAFGIREHQVVFGGISTVVVVEAGVHAAELGQAHRHVAVVEDDGNSESLAQPRRDAAEVRHRHREDDDGGDVAFALEDALEVALPTRRDIAPDRPAGEPVRDCVLRLLLSAPEQRVALEPGGDATCPREELRLAVERVRSRPPPGRLDRPPPVGRDDEVDADLVEALPDLPPGGGAAVAEVEIGRRGDREDLGCRGHRLSMAKASACRRRAEEAVRAFPGGPF